ncbi:TPA: hypothetical protein PC648_001076 [Klebsiella variicola]|nr:hypothetical protein [Klebsiella variicola]
MKDFRHQFIGCFHWRFIHIGTESRLFDGFLWQKVTTLIEYVPGKTIRSLVIAGFSTTTASHTQRARFTVTRQKASAQAVRYAQALCGHQV